MADGGLEEGILEAEVIEEMERLPAVRESNALVARGELTVEELIGQADKIKQVMAAAMRENVHYGKIPGVNKPTLLKPGAEMLNVLLRLAPSYDSERVFHDDDHLTVVSKCTLTHIPTGYVVAEGEGLCSTREVKYRYRTGGRICPDCGTDAIIKGKEEYGGGWFCFKRKGGCGNKWDDGTDQAARFESMDTGRVENQDLADTWNTVLKMADKRALLAACLNGTAASDIFTQDAEDLPPAVAPGAPQKTKEFNAETDLMEGGVAPKDAAKALAEIDPLVEWGEVFSQLDTGWRDLGGKKRDDFWRRAANAATWMGNVAPAGTVPPITDEQIVAAFAFAFSGEVVEVFRQEPEKGLLTEEQQEQLGEMPDDVDWPGVAPE